MDGPAPSFEEARTQFKTNCSLEGPDPKEDKMPTPRRQRRPSPTAGARWTDGCTETLMLAAGRETGPTDDAWERHDLFRCGAFIAARSHRPSINIRKRPPNIQNQV